MDNDTRLIEVAFPLKQASLDSVHEKNVRHGHISTLHIWPARRPLAAARAALLATLLPAPGTPEARQQLVERIGGRVTKTVDEKGGKVKEETVGGVLHWGRESSPDMDWFRDQIRQAYGGRAPKVLDPFAGGGAIPLEAMRLGCDVTAVDINPVAWFILKCTLEYPQKLAGQTRPLPDFALQSPEFMQAFLHQGEKPGKSRTKPATSSEQMDFLAVPEADLAWHVRAWGQWVLDQAQAELARFYPTIDGKPTVAYLWARTVTCKHCRHTIPLLKTRWLAKKDKKRVRLTMEPNADRSAVIFDIETNVPVVGGNAAQKRAHDKQIGQGTMSRSGAQCPLCGTIMTMEDIRLEGRAGRLGTVMTAVVVDGAKGKEYRLPTPEEIRMAEAAADELERVYADIPFGIPDEPLPSKEALGFRVPLYGFDKWSKLFTPRQLLAMGVLISKIRSSWKQLESQQYSEEWRRAIFSYLSLAIDKLADYGSSLCTWHISGEKMSHVFVRFALPITWDFAELNPVSQSTGNFLAQVEWIARVSQHTLQAATDSPLPKVENLSALVMSDTGLVDIVLTDPPYYDAIPYSDLMDYFYVWLRRVSHQHPIISDVYGEILSPKWSETANDGELIDDASRFGGDQDRSKQNYENGMYRVFKYCYQVLAPGGRTVIVFAHKQPDAWETLVSAIIRAGFVVDASWPIQTEMGNRTRAQSSAALSSSVWLVCKKRDAMVRPGWDTTVLDDMQQRLSQRLHDYWDAGIRGPDFVWAATGPAMEAYSRYPVVKKANSPGEVMTVSEFLQHVRRLVVDFVVGRMLSQTGGVEAVSGLDDLTTYYLLHRYDFGMDPAPIGAVILYAVSCGLSDTALTHQWDLLSRFGSSHDDDEDEAEETAEEVPKGDTARLKTWRQRTGKALGEDVPGRPAPLIDQIHHLMQLWSAGDVAPVDAYLDRRGLRRHAIFAPLLQALIELAEAGSQERSLLESLSNHVQHRGMAPDRQQPRFMGMEEI
ncbi:MAG: hypothetical protein C7B45_15340 [Sulfobacillus acidophilus]|uniref:DUF1156 domain-containing protein n=1 Tax=Sulfobacillus acidophilus TaxID=53633 RepID=A0A2T2WDM8_9FIRM|nr:MAG: hypothetical protein C7B45_15340 [Sulfobacillus acidophilus]